MTNKELQKLLSGFPDDMPIKLLTKSDIPVRDYKDAPIIEFIHGGTTTVAINQGLIAQ